MSNYKKEAPMAEQSSNGGFIDIRGPAWMLLYEELSPDEVDAIFRICGYEILPTGKLSRRYIAIQLDEDKKAVLDAQAKSSGHTAAEEAGAILASALTQLAEAQSDEAGEPAAHE
jgi:hypothetical protein